MRKSRLAFTSKPHSRNPTILLLVPLLMTLVLSPALTAYANSTVRASGPLGSQSLVVPPDRTAILTDPSGTYVFHFINTSSYTVNATAYRLLMHDPYSILPISKSQAIGNEIEITMPNNLGFRHSPHASSNQIVSQGPASGTPIVFTTNWAGPGGGDCTSMSIDSSQSGLLCNGSQGSLGTAGVDSAKLTWQSSCYSGTSCQTSYWAGLSPQDEHSSQLVQNGIAVCVNDPTDCSGGGHSGVFTWDTWFQFLPDNASGILTSAQHQPPAINSDFHYQFVVAYATPTSRTTATFEWIVGPNWSYYLSWNDPDLPQTTFQQAEAIMEQFQGTPLYMDKWSPNPNVMTGWWETGNWCGCTYQSGYFGTSNSVGFYDLTSDGTSHGTRIAYPTLVSSTQFKIFV